MAVLHADRPPAAVTVAMIEGLNARGIESDLVTIGARPIAVTDAKWTAGLYVLKHSDEPALVAAGLLHRAGAATFNPYPAVALCRDKAAVMGRLAEAGLPTPRSWLVSDPKSARQLLEDGPVIVKPNSGSKGLGVRVVRAETDLSTVDTAGGPFLVQRYHEPEGLDRKLYHIGDRLFCIGRPWPAVTPEEKQGILLDVDPVLRRVAVAVGRALGIDVFGADVVISAGRAWLVDVSSFPGFKGVPSAGELLASRVARAFDQAEVGAQ